MSMKPARFESSSKRKADEVTSDEPRQVPHIERRDARTGRVLGVHATLAEAKSVSGVSGKLIKKGECTRSKRLVSAVLLLYTQLIYRVVLFLNIACREGGGMVKGSYFRFLSEEGEEGDFDENFEDDEEEDDFARPPKKRKITKKPAISASEAEAISIAQSALGGPIPPYTFDVSMLAPVRKTNEKPRVRPPKLIDLLDKGTQEVLCCFRGVTNAARALGLTRDAVTKHCLHPHNRELEFKTFALRYSTKLVHNVCFPQLTHHRTFPKHKRVAKQVCSSQHISFSLRVWGPSRGPQGDQRDSSSTNGTVETSGGLGSSRARV